MWLSFDLTSEALRLAAEARELRMLTRHNIAQSHKIRGSVRRTQRDFRKFVLGLREEQAGRGL